MRRSGAALAALLLCAAVREADLSLHSDGGTQQLPQHPGSARAQHVLACAGAPHPRSSSMPSRHLYGARVIGLATGPLATLPDAVAGKPAEAAAAAAAAAVGARLAEVLAGAVPACDKGRPAGGLLSDVSSEAFSEPVHLASAVSLAGIGAGGAARSRVGKRLLWTKGAASNWLGFEEAKQLVRSLACSRRADFWAWWKRERPADLPYNPDKAYRCERRADAACLRSARAASARVVADGRQRAQGAGLGGLGRLPRE